MDIFQEATILNRIITDMRPIIQEYLHTYPLFVIGKHNSSYPGYRIITENDFECKQTIKTFIKYYKYHKGLPAIDSFNGAVLCCKEYPFYCNLRYIRCTLSDLYEDWDSFCIISGNVISFKISYPQLLMTSIKNICFSKDTYMDEIKYKIGLYVKCN